MTLKATVRLSAAFAALACAGCVNQLETTAFRMPDGRQGSFVTLSGDGFTPPVVALMTPKASPYDVHVVSAAPLAQSVLQGAVAGAEVGGGLALEGALIRPTRVSAVGNSATSTATTTSQASAVGP